MKKSLKLVFIVGILLIAIIIMTGCGAETKNEGKVEENNQEEQQVETVAEFSRGTWEENVYTNDYASIKFTLPEGWAKATDEQIAAMMNVGVEMLNDDQKDMAELTNQTSVYCFVVNDPNTGANVSVLLEKPMLTVTPEFYLTSLKQQLEAVNSINYEIGEISDTKLGSNDFKVLNAQATQSGITMNQSYFSKEANDHILTVIATTTQDGQLEEIMKCFE